VVTGVVVAVVRVVAVLVLTFPTLVQALRGRVIMALRLLAITILPVVAVAVLVQLAVPHKVRRLLLPVV
jgi:hypothetical protein